MKTNIVLTQADALAIPLPDNSAHCMVTSPPYWALRDYGVGVEMGELGQEPFADCLGWATGYPCRFCHVCNLVFVFREIRRVMHPSGVAWLNYGDMYATEAPRGRYGDQGDLSTGDHGELGPQRNIGNLPRGVKKGDRLLMAHRIALALQADGWWVRSAPIWRKVNPLPQPAQVYRRPVDSYEMMFMLIKDYRHYYYDAEAVREESSSEWLPGVRGYRRTPNEAHRQIPEWEGGSVNTATRHLRDVWDIATQGWKGAHFATYPERLVEPCIKSTTSEYGVCAKCKAPWRRIVEKSEPVPRPDNPNPVRSYTAESGHTNATGATTLHQIVETRTVGWEPTCKCTFASGESLIEPALVLDPFVGSGTTCKVARDLGRTSVGLDISLEYLLNEATERLITYNVIGARLGQLRKAKPGKTLSDLPLFQGA